MSSIRRDRVTARKIAPSATPATLTFSYVIIIRVLYERQGFPRIIISADRKGEDAARKDARRVQRRVLALPRIEGDLTSRELPSENRFSDSADSCLVRFRSGDFIRSTRSATLKRQRGGSEIRRSPRSGDPKIRSAERYGAMYPARTSLRTVHRVRVPVSMKLNLIPASPRPPSSEAEVGGTRGSEGRLAVVRHPRKGGAPRGARLTRHPAGSSHSYCQLPTLRPSRSSLALDFG